MSADESAGLKKAASLILKGGTLTNDQCTLCRGILVRFEDKEICVSCGRQSDETAAQEVKHVVSAPADMESVAAIVRQKIHEAAEELKGDRDVESQRRRAELIEAFVRLLQALGK